SDVTSAMQVQRGLGSSKLAIASVGGTVNIITRSSDKKEGGIVSVGLGNNDYLKTLFAYNTGKLNGGWSSSFLMSRTAGSTYADGTQFEGYNYYFALGYKPNKRHDFQFTMTGAPQWHNNRFSYTTIQDYIKYNNGDGTNPNRKYNPDWGYRNGEVFSNRVNYYHKPVISLNWDWNISEKSKLNTVFYASFGRGAGVNGNVGKAGTKSFTDPSFKTADGQINWDAIYSANGAINANTAAAGGTLVQAASVNSHNWFGTISSFNHKINRNLNFTLGLDARYYYGYHYQLVSSFLGANGYKDNKNQNVGDNVVVNAFEPRPSWNPFGGSINNISDMIAYDNDGEVLWYGGFGQLEYTKDNFSAFVQGALSNQSFQRIDNFIIDGKTLLNGTIAGTPATNQPTALNPALNTKTGFKDILGYNIKAGANYNINEQHNVFANIGYYSKQPFLNSVYPNNKNYLNPNLTNEKIFGVELGYGFRSGVFSGNFNLYRTSWKDRFLRKTNITVTYPDPSNPGTNLTTSTAYANISGITEIHQGAELDFVATANKYISFTGMFSYGDWYYQGNAEGTMFTETNEPIVNGNAATTVLYLDKVKVGSSAQLTAAAGITIKPAKDLDFNAQYRYVDNLYGNINPINFQTQAGGDIGAMKLPAFWLMDIGASYKLRLQNAKQYFTLRANVYNLFDKVYIAESNTNIHSGLTAQQYTDINGGTVASNTAKYASYVGAGNWNGVSQQNQVYYGFGTTWTASLSFNF
ncbi:MAG: TonB-dependent receptor, partial [Bacteroidetes bacterium]|nr:TonB-dependent receptor [Bacteroidota bacterium]